MEDLFSAGFWDCVRDYERSGQRKGQAVFNAAAFFYPEETRALHSSSVDPFYGDGKVSAFLTALAEKLTA